MKFAEITSLSAGSVESDPAIAGSNVKRPRRVPAAGSAAVGYGEGMGCFAVMLTRTAA